MTLSLVLTVVGPDRPGLVNRIADLATSHGGNWQEARMANLAGQFAGVVHLRLPVARVDDFEQALATLAPLGLRIVATRGVPQAPGAGHRLQLELVGQDRPGIVRDISRELLARGVSIEELVTDCASGAMSGESLFRAHAQLVVPAGLPTAELRRALEAIANDLMVDVTLDESAS